MDPITIIAIATATMKFAVEYGVPAARALKGLIDKPAPTQEDWEAMWNTATTRTDKFLERTKGLDAPVTAG